MGGTAAFLSTSEILVLCIAAPRILNVRERKKCVKEKAAVRAEQKKAEKKAKDDKAEDKKQEKKVKDTKADDKAGDDSKRKRGRSPSKSKRGGKR